MPLVLDHKKTFDQLWRVVIVNLTGAGIDYGLLFLFSKFTGVTRGNWIIPLNMISFSVATIYTFHFNKKWSFGDHNPLDYGKKFSLFVIVSIVGLVVNTSVLRLISTNVQPLAGFSPVQWLFASKVAASLCSFTWNFSGYKVVVFKK